MHNTQQEPIAIIGMGCRFPGANTPQEFWNLLREGKHAISEVPPTRWNAGAFYDPDPMCPGKTISRWGGFLEQVDQFDWRTFRMLPREARAMDPQHRLLLEVAWEALEDAGLPLEEVAGTQTGVSIGIGWSDYLRLQTRNWSHIDAYTAMGNASSFAANRLSYAFDLKGPSFSLDAGCTSSLVALHLACQSLWAGETTMALAGGVNLMLSPDGMILVSKAGLLSPDGRCKTLDAHANGFVRGEGAGIVILKRLSDVRSSDRIYALIRSVAVNHNGHNEWIIASSQSAQAALLRTAYAKASSDPVDVDYVELHGTGFLRGDLVEVKALGSVLSKNREYPCRIGSVKTNIGHLEAAAGIASIIKVALSLYHREIPPTLNIETLNPALSPQEYHLEAPQSTCPWPKKEKLPLAGVTTLAFTGANAHAVLSAIPDTVTVQPAQPNGDREYHLLSLSARSQDALHALVSAFKDFLHNSETRHDRSLQNICYTASVRRTHHDYRFAAIGRTGGEIADILEALLERQTSQNLSTGKIIPQRQRKLVLLCAGHLPQQIVNACILLFQEKAFHSTVDECERLFYQYGQKPGLWQALYSAANTDAELSASVLFTLQVALAAQWKAWGVIPDALFGEGLGEITVAYLAGALTLPQAIEMIISHTLIGRELQLITSTQDSQNFSVLQVPLYLKSTGLS